MAGCGRGVPVIQGQTPFYPNNKQSTGFLASNDRRPVYPSCRQWFFILRFMGKRSGIPFRGFYFWSCFSAFFGGSRRGFRGGSFFPLFASFSVSSILNTACRSLLGIYCLLECILKINVRTIVCFTYSINLSKECVATVIARSPSVSAPVDLSAGSSTRDSRSHDPGN